MLMMLAVCFIMAACGSEAADKVASKIQSGETLDQKDYAVMVDYCAKYAESAQKLQDQINLLSPTSAEAGKLTDQIASLTDKFPLANEFFEKISTVAKDQVSAETQVKINSLASLTWFTAPAWADISTDTTVVGDIVEMPSEDTAGVIAAGDGEVVEDAK